MEDDLKTTPGHVEVVDSNVEEIDPVKQAAISAQTFDGDVNLAGPGDVVYLIPTPSPDPRGTEPSPKFQPPEVGSPHHL